MESFASTGQSAGASVIRFRPQGAEFWGPDGHFCRLMPHVALSAALHRRRLLYNAGIDTTDAPWTGIVPGVNGSAFQVRGREAQR